MLHLLAAALLAMQTPQSAPPRTPEQQQADGQAALQGMVEIFTVMGSCERHFTPQQVQGVRQALEPERGQPRSPLQNYLEQAYQTGKADQSRSAAFCQEAMRVLAESRARSVPGH